MNAIGSDAPPFLGFTPAATEFFTHLAANNTREFWQSQRAVWEQQVQAPMRALLAGLDAAFQPLHTFRMNRDVRFSPDKSPYKTMHGAAHERPGGSVNYLHLAADGLLVAAGAYTLASDQLERFRAAIADDQSGPEIEALISASARPGLEIGPGMAPPLKTAPRGYQPDHPRIALLRWKGLMAVTTFPPETLADPELPQRVSAVWHGVMPLCDWLDTHVGPSTLPPPSAGTR